MGFAPPSTLQERFLCVSPGIRLRGWLPRLPETFMVRFRLLVHLIALLTFLSRRFLTPLVVHLGLPLEETFIVKRRGCAGCRYRHRGLLAHQNPLFTNLLFIGVLGSADFPSLLLLHPRDFFFNSRIAISLLVDRLWSPGIVS